MTVYEDRAGLQVAAELAGLIEQEVLPGLGLDPAGFWSGTAAVFARFAPENRALLAHRDALQARIDDWHDGRRGRPYDVAASQTFLREIGYLVEEPQPFTIGTTGVDAEIARMAGPQLVVPILNARFLLNAANARWGSLYDALYGTDALGDLPKGGGYDPERGARVVARAKAFLDEAVPLTDGSWSDLTDIDAAVLKDPAQLAGRTEGSRLFRHNGLHIEVIVDRAHPVGRTDPAGIADVVLESALTTICDLEDSVAAVDAADKVCAYRNWLGLMKGDLVETFDKGGKTLTRRLNPDRAFIAPDGSTLTLKGRSLLFVRNVGHLMTTPAVRLPDEAVDVQPVCGDAEMHDRRAVDPHQRLGPPVRQHRVMLPPQAGNGTGFGKIERGMSHGGRARLEIAQLRGQRHPLPRHQEGGIDRRQRLGQRVADPADPQTVDVEGAEAGQVVAVARPDVVEEGHAVRLDRRGDRRNSGVG